MQLLHNSLLSGTPLTCTPPHCARHTTADTCPPPDAFSIVCRPNSVPACGPGAKPFLLDTLCTAFPVGAQLQWYRAESLYETSTGNALYNLGTTVYQPPIVTCPAGANGTTVWWPAITAFKGRTNCFCTIGATTCRFTTTTTSTPPAGSAAVTTNPAINITVYGERGRGREGVAAFAAI